ncbi:MAG TPA: response regulator transcription factor [Verrucomicrobiae bacterium]|nr:response regulator transcription factor [Verrucomicrobiae bacterium]
MTAVAQKQKRKVFLVDDHPLVREWLTNLINQQPDLVVCGETESAPQALQAIAQARPDVAIVDISLKDSSGIELIKSLKQSQPAVAVLVLSMHDESLYAERALRAGAKGYIMKRETTKKVIDAIRRVLEGKLYISNIVAEAITARSVTGKVPASQTPIEQLSDRELEVFEMLGQGLGTRQIAETLRVSIKTVQVYCARMKEKMNLGSGTELLREAFRWNETKHPR